MHQTLQIGIVSQMSTFHHTFSFDVSLSILKEKTGNRLVALTASRSVQHCMPKLYFFFLTCNFVGHSTSALSKFAVHCDGLDGKGPPIDSDSNISVASSVICHTVSCVSNISGRAIVGFACHARDFGHSQIR